MLLFAGVFCILGVCVWNCNKGTVKCDTSLHNKGNRRNSKQRPTATVWAQLCSGRRNSPRQMAGPRPPRPQATLHPGTRIPNRALLSLSPAAPPLTMLSHLPDLLWLPSAIMTVERPTQRRSRGCPLPGERRDHGKPRSNRSLHLASSGGSRFLSGAAAGSSQIAVIFYGLGVAAHSNSLTLYTLCWMYRGSSCVSRGWRQSSERSTLTSSRKSLAI